MLSVRVVWDGLVRFFTLPLRSSFDTLLREVLAKFDLTAGAAVDLLWREGDVSFSLDSQTAWQDCLQRRGLAEKPGRLEICVESRSAVGAGVAPAPVPRRKRPVVSLPAGASAAAEAVPAGDESICQAAPANAVDFLVTGTQALRSSTSGGSAPKSSGKTAKASARGGGIVGKQRRTNAAASSGRTQAGKAWATSLGRDGPIYWDKRAGGRTSTPPIAGYTPPEGLSLEGRAATAARKR